ncbi:MAG: choloylglycine hydrolase, partial [Cellulosilyticaceae bacterium]
GRNMDLEYNFNQHVTLVPRQFKWTNVVTGDANTTQHAILGMASVVNDHPLFADGFNEKGLACAGLNFPGYAYYEPEVQEDKVNLGPYDLMLWILGQFERVADVKEAMTRIDLIAKPFAEGLPLATLHWMVTDRNGESIVIEKTKEGLKVYDNTVGVLTNSPTFDWHLTNLRQYIGLQSTQPDSAIWDKANLTPLGQGVGLHGLPGDFSPASRFVRTAYLKSHAAFINTLDEGVAEFFHILANVAMVCGAVTTPEGKNDITLYTACMCQEKGIYYYTTYENQQIIGIDMHQEDLEASGLKVFEYKKTPTIVIQNA